MVMMRVVGCAAAFGIGLVNLVQSGSGGLARTVRHRPVYVSCTGAPPEYDPRDLNQLRASVSASSRLVLAIREREFLASCHPASHYPRHYTD